MMMSPNTTTNGDGNDNNFRYTEDTTVEDNINYDNCMTRRKKKKEQSKILSEQVRYVIIPSIQTKLY